MTRLDAAKAFFRKFAEQALRFKVDNFYGLVEFESNVYLRSKLAPVSADFRNQVDAMKFKRATSMFHAIDLAINELRAERQKFGKDVGMRIICLTDGFATDPDMAGRVSQRLVQEKIRLDAVFASSELECGLIALTKMTGGIFVRPASIEDANSIFEDEAFFNSAMRKYDAFSNRGYDSLRQELSQNRAQQAGCLRVPVQTTINTSGKFVSPSWVVRDRKDRQDLTLRDARLVSELKMIAVNENESFQVFVDKDNIGIWTILVEGPEGSPYADRWWRLMMQFPREYPSNGPMIRFSDPPYHLNVSDQGRMILPEVQDYYIESFHIFEIVEEIRIGLMSVNEKNPIDEDHLSVYRNSGAYQAKIQEYNLQHSKGSVEEWNMRCEDAELPEDDDDDVVVPRQFICPISDTIMVNPVRSPTTRLFYEKGALEQLLRINSRARCPVTGKLFGECDRGLSVDVQMKHLIGEYKRHNG